jgi:hypothetical protein
MARMKPITACALAVAAVALAVAAVALAGCRDRRATPVADGSRDVAACPSELAPGMRLVAFGGGAAPTLVMKKGSEKLEQAFALRDEIVAAYNGARLDDPNATPPLITVDVAADTQRAAAEDAEWLNSALAALPPDVLAHARLRLVAKPNDRCLLPLPLGALRHATGAWSEVASRLHDRDERTAPSADDLRESVAAALRWNEKGCGAGSGRACYQAAHFSTPTAARALYKKSCDLGVADGCSALADALLKGAPADARAGAALLRKSCDAGDREACTKWIDHLLQGSPADQKLAVERLRKACQGTDAESCERLGEMTLYGQSVARDLEKARALLQRGCDRGASRACFLLRAPDFEAP